MSARDLQLTASVSVLEKEGNIENGEGEITLYGGSKYKGEFKVRYKYIQNVI